MSGNVIAVLQNNPEDQGWKQAVKRQLHVPRPHTDRARGFFQHLLEVHARQATHARRDEHRRQTERVVHLRTGIHVRVDALVRCRPLHDTTRALRERINGPACELSRHVHCAIRRLAQLVYRSREEVVAGVVDHKRGLF